MIGRRSFWIVAMNANNFVFKAELKHPKSSHIEITLSVFSQRLASEAPCLNSCFRSTFTFSKACEVFLHHLRVFSAL